MPGTSPRTRLIFQNSNLFVAPAGQNGTTATGALYSSGNSGVSYFQEISRVQSIDLSVGIARQDINVFGRLNRISAEILTPPTINLNFSYYLTDGANEDALGFAAKGGGSFVSGMITNTSNSKNYFVSYSPQGQDDDSFATANQRDVIGIGNGYITNYSINAAVNQPVTASASVEGFNIAFYTGSSNKTTPAVNPYNSARINNWTFTLPVGDAQTGVNTLPILKPGDIVMSIPNSAGFGSYVSGDYAVNIQSFTLSVPIARQRILKLGSPFGISNEIQFPVNCTLSMQAVQTDLQENSLDQLICNDSQKDVAILLRKAGCNGTGAPAINLQFNRAYTTNYALNQTIGNNATVTIDMNAQLAGATNTDGVVFSGYF